MNSQRIMKLAFLLVVVITGAGWMFGIKTKVSGEWKARLSNVEVFNRYSAAHKIELKDAILEGYSLEGAEFKNGHFENTDWKDTEFRDSTIENATFNKGEYRNASFSGSVLKNVVFSNITFYSADFGQTELDGVKFVNCNFGRAKFHGLEKSKVEFDGSVLEEVRFFDSDVDVKFINSKLTSVGMMGTTAVDYLVVKGSDVYDVDLGSSVIPHLEITDSTVKKVVFSGGKAKSLVMRNLKGAWQASGATIDEIVVENVDTEVLFLAGTTANTVKISGVTVTGSFNGRLKAKSVVISNSNIRSIWNGASRVDVFKIVDSELRGTRNENSHFGTFHLENVILNGIFNFENTKADSLELVNVTKGPNYEFLGDGGNIKF